MTFRKRILYFLVKNLRISNKQSHQLLLDEKITVNGEIVNALFEINETDTICFQNQVLQQGKCYNYFKYYKPRGIECTLNPGIEHNLLTSVLVPEGFFPIGRLDKESEGLMLFTNNGFIMNKILKHENNMEKEYEVTVNKQLAAEFIHALETGITIMGQKTLPTKVIQIDDFTFIITLIQGLNRQIRRMCYKFDYEVTKLKRIRMMNLLIENMIENEVKYLNEEELESAEWL